MPVDRLPRIPKSGFCEGCKAPSLTAYCERCAPPTPRYDDPVKPMQVPRAHRHNGKVTRPVGVLPY